MDKKPENVAPQDTEELFPVVYDSLRDLARRYMAGERIDHTLTPTALVHEAYFRLTGERFHWDNEGHLVGATARAMRRVLISWARRHNRRRDKIGPRVPLHASICVKYPELFADPEALDAALDELERVSRRQADVVHLRIFAELTIKQTASALGVSARTVTSDWTHAHAWLRQRLAADGE